MSIVERIEMEERIKALEETLRFYADSGNYQEPYSCGDPRCCGDPGESEVAEDGGRQARQALGIQEPKREPDPVYVPWKPKSYPCSTGQHTYHRSGDTQAECKRKHDESLRKRFYRFTKECNALGSARVIS